MSTPLPAGVSAGYLRLGGNVPGKWQSPQARRVADVTSVAAPLLQAEVKPTDLGPAIMPKAMAKEMGFTGDQCSNCNSMKMKVSGHCMVCEDCGTTTGCS